MRLLLGLMLFAGSSLISGCSDTDKIPEGDAAKALRSDTRGYKTSEGTLIGTDNAAYWVQQALTGFRSTNEEDLPASVTVEHPIATCEFRPPSADEYVANVHIGKSRMATPIYMFSRTDLAKRTKDWLARSKQQGENASSAADPGGDALRAIDVVVTETSKPVYLVLQNEWSNVVWNVHAADGVRINGVAALGSGSVGVANVDPSVPIQFMNGKTLSSCRIVPVREPADYWSFVQRAKNGTSGDLTDKLEENRQMHRAYSRWFSSNFGKSSETDLVGIDEASQVLVGPPPSSLDKRVAYHSLKGAKVRVAYEDYVLVSDKEEYRANHDKLVRELAEQMTGKSPTNGS